MLRLRGNCASLVTTYSKSQSLPLQVWRVEGRLQHSLGPGHCKKHPLAQVQQHELLLRPHQASPAVISVRHPTFRLDRHEV